MEIILKCNGMTLFFIVCLAAFFNTGILIVAEKWGIVDWYVRKRLDWMPQCDFCAFFWLSVIELNIIYFKSVHPFDLWLYIMVFILSLCSAVLSRFVK